MATQFQRLFVPTAAVFAVVLCAGPDPLRADVPVELTRVGDPIWRPVDFHLFTAPADSEEALFTVAESILGTLDSQRNPPYDNIFSNGLDAAGLESASTFLPSEIAGQPAGVYYVYTLVPDPGTTGSSFDFASGPIIPNHLFPLTDSTDLVREGVVVDGEFDSELSPFEGFDGYSHSWSFLVGHAGFFPPGTELMGNFEYRSMLRDAEGNGWNMVAPFQVVPEPGNLALSLILLLSARVGVLRFAAPAMCRSGRTTRSNTDNRSETL